MKHKKKQIKETHCNQQNQTEMTQMLEQPDRAFKITMINILEALM